jgi:hydroxyethylthiazole kinase-like uncharacterized protein yjeF
MDVVTAAQMQEMDRCTIETFGIPGRVLMENAGRGATRLFIDRLYANGRPGRVGIAAGRGNNGGDGFVVARYLAQRGIQTTVYLLTSAATLKGDAAANFNLLKDSGVPVVEIHDEPAFASKKAEMLLEDYWIDAIFGTGLNSDVRGFYHSAIAFLNEMSAPVFSIDIPSGLNADTGQPCGICIQAAATATFAAIKIGLVLYPGASHCGTVDVVDIGIPPGMANHANVRQHLITADHVRTIIGNRPLDIHKGKTGHALVVAGATGKTGAAAMATTSVLRAGAGLVTLGIPESLNPILEQQVVEAMTLPLPDQGTGQLLEEAFDIIVGAAATKQAMAIGPGLGTAAHTRNLVSRIIKETDIPLVIDADGLNNLAGHLGWLKGRKGATVLTPHPGEMARLLGLSVLRIQQDRLQAARTLAVQNNVYVVLKGARTLVAAPSGGIWINPTGNPGMASGGMGDVLTGLICGFLSQGIDAEEACHAGVFLHGLAADRVAADSSWGYLATEVTAAVPKAIHCVLHHPPSPPYETAPL